MSIDRFDHRVDRKVETKPARLQRIEVITGVERRRAWSQEEKRAILTESFEDGVVISEVARRYGLTVQRSNPGDLREGPTLELVARDRRRDR